jgi:hypothetical protein
MLQQQQHLHMHMQGLSVVWQVQPVGQLQVVQAAWCMGGKEAGLAVHSSDVTAGSPSAANMHMRVLAC